MTLLDSGFARAGRRIVLALTLVSCGPTGAVHAQDLTDARVLSPQDLATFGSNQSPAIATDGTTWIATWWSQLMSGTWSIQIARSTNHGETWSLVSNGNDVNQPLFAGGANIFTAVCGDVQPDVAAGAAGEFVIVWGRQAGDHTQLFSSISTDGGVSWSAPSQLTTNPRNECPHIAYGPDQETGGTNRWIVTWASGVAGNQDWDIQVASVDPNPLAMTLQNQVELTSDPNTTNVYPSIATDGAGRWLIGWSSNDNTIDTVRYAYSNDLTAPWNVGVVAGYTSSTCGHGGGNRPTRANTDGTVWGIHFLLTQGYEATSLWPPTSLTLTSCTPLSDFAMNDAKANPATGEWVMSGTVFEFDGESFRRLKILRGTGNPTTGAVDWEASSIFVYPSVNHGTSAESGASLGDSYGADIATNGTHWVMLWSSTDSLEVGSPASSHEGSMLVTSTPRCGDGNQDADEACDDGGRTYDPLCDSNCTIPACGNGAASGGEGCDDGNLTDGDGCDGNCTVTGCPNGIVTAGEACDDGDAINGDECDSNCTLPACGNGIAAGAEACDDGNPDEGDGCDSNCTVSACGNGIQAGAEACDDGNLDDGDGCDSNCTITGCQNGIQTAGEACDDGNAVEGDGCDTNCTITGCQNGIQTAGEACDDGNLTDGDGCDGNCTPTGCPNGVATAGEACDDGDAINGDECDSNCTLPACGNGIAAGAEACDDGDLDDGDGCDSNCTPTGCANGVMTAGEACDDGDAVNGDECDSNCTIPACGNGIQAGAETCDDGNLGDGDGCDGNCTPTGCPNGVVTAGEACDDGDAVNGDECDSNCTPHQCGNEIVAGTETCDDGDVEDGDGCDSNCTPTGCPNGIRTGTELCDDGNLSDADGCSNSCTVIGCGDGTVGGGEGCDDANVASDDGCDANCQPTSCGNGIVTTGEECDDGNLDDGDACESNCTTPRCGNAIVSDAEDCDDGNAVNGDGCDNNCTRSDCGNGTRFGSEHCDDGNNIDGDGCESDCLLTPVSVSEDLPVGGTLSTDGGSGPTPQYPVSTGVTAPNGGNVSISQDTMGTSNLTQGYLFLGQQMLITAPEATAEQPLEIFFTLEGSLAPPAVLTHSFASIYRNGVLVGDCTGPAGHAVPTPCVSSRAVDGNGDYRFSVLTAAASQWMMTTPAHDVVVLPAKPVKLTLPAGAADYTKKLSVKVANADTGSGEPVTVQVVASTTCPAATVAADFDKSTPEPDDTVVIQPGKTAKATALLQFRASSMHSIAPVNEDAPFRCAVTYQAVVTGPEGSQDINESNDSFTVQGVNIANENVESSAATESVAVSGKPIRIKIPEASGDPVVTKTAKLTVFNADVVPAPAAPGHEIEVTTDDGTCPDGTVGLADFDPSTDGAQSSALVAGGKKRAARVAITVRSSDFTSPGAKSPARCIATVTTSGPVGDLDGTNDVTNLVIDVTDLNDFD